MLGGRPVNRTSRSKTVDVISEIFNNETEFKLGISPEGTRKKVKKWKTGFYYIAKKASVPIISVTLNFKDKNVNFSSPFYPTDNFETDLKKIRSFFRDVKGKIPKYS
jgi:1-acyl-sn-glycerol-3-phosphate acyltransferase